MNDQLQDLERQTFKDLWNKVQKDIHELAKTKGWWQKERNDGELIALIHSELSEALEAIRHGNPPDDKLTHRSGAEVELADAIIRILDMAEARGWDVVGSLLEKHEYNKTREYRHGGKKF